jgi:hypothetical protein
MFINFSQILSVRSAWKKVEFGNDKFLELSSEIFKNIEIGGTFIPENLIYNGLSESQVMDCLKYIVETMDIRRLRVGIRLNKIDLDSENFGIYHDILQYCFLHNIKLTLNLGPIKYCGWPEYHLSDNIKSSVGVLPSSKSIIAASCDLSAVSLSELQKLLLIIVKRYTKKQLQNIVTLQAENEGFNPFGEYKWTFENSHLTSIIKLFDLYLPDRQILFNSAGFFDLDHIISFIKTRPDPKRFKVGLDYYYTFDKLDKFKFYRWFDLFVFSWQLKNFGLNQLKNLQNIYGFSTEVTEAQMEPWGEAKQPGNSIESLKFVLLRSAQFLKNNNGVICMYGLDSFAKNAVCGMQTNHHIDMLDLIKKIQNKSNPNPV